MSFELHRGTQAKIKWQNFRRRCAFHFYLRRLAYFAPLGILLVFALYVISTTRSDYGNYHLSNEASHFQQSFNKIMSVNVTKETRLRENDLNLPTEPLLNDVVKGRIQSEIEKVTSTNWEALQIYRQKMKPFVKAQGMPTDEQVLQKQRHNIIKEMEDYPLHEYLRANSFEELIPELGGTPVINLVVTTWRSGSTFLGDVLNSHPATYYHYEPLLDFGIKQIRYGEMAERAVSNLLQLVHCNFTGLENHLQYGKEHPWLFSHNDRLWWICFVFREFCYRPEFMSQFCALFPFQSMKIVRLRMNLTEHFLSDKRLDVRVLLLVRDPRGTMQSRHHRHFCPGNEDCSEPHLLCQDLVSDYHSALELMKKFPRKVKIVRYEDLSLNAYNYTKEIFDFFRLNYVGTVEDFLESHTKLTKGDVSSTFRDSKQAPIHWRQELSFEEVDTIQSKCHRALSLFGYNIANNAQHLLQFNPIGRFEINIL